MGARQSKRSVDITTDPKKVAEGSTEGGQCELEGRVGKIEDADSQNIANGLEAEAKNEETDETEEVVENGACNIGSGDVPVSEEPIKHVPDESADSKPIETNNEENTETAAADAKKNKKDKVKKKWSFRNLTFSKKDKSKPSKDLDKSVEEKDISPEGSNDAVKEDEMKSSKENLEEKDITENNAADAVDPANKEGNECSTVEVEKTIEESTVSMKNKTEIHSENISSQCEIKTSEIHSENISSQDEMKTSEKIENTVPVVKSESVEENLSNSTKSDITENVLNTVITTEKESVKQELVEIKTEIITVTKPEIFPTESIDKTEAANDNIIEIIQNEGATSFVEKELIENDTSNTIKDVPPPLPASPPPSPLSALAQSTMAETVPTEFLNSTSEENITPETNAQTILVTECNIPEKDMESEKASHEDLDSSAQSQITETVIECTSIKTIEIVENSQHSEDTEETILESQEKCSVVEPILNIETNAMTIEVDEPVTLPPATESVNEMECASDDLPSPPVAESPELIDPPMLTNEEPIIVTQLSEGDSYKKKLDIPMLNEDINDEQTDIIKQDIMTAGEIVCSNGSN